VGVLVVQALHLAADAVGVSPAWANTGSPKTTATGGRPAFGHFDPRGCAAWAPMMATGSTGTSDWLASAAAPTLNWPILPVRLRVPSGKMMSGTPRASRPRASDAGRLMPARWIGKALKNSAVSPLRHFTSKK
jgi:hypothetical protein